MLVGGWGECPGERRADAQVKEPPHDQQCWRFFFFFNDTATTELYTLSLHDALPICMPAHLRWELYPIPKGPKARQRYGGSYFEESDWWTKPLKTSHRSEVAFVLKEVFLLRGVWESFRGLWVWSWLLHWGLYLYVLATLLAVGEVLLPASAGLGMLHAVVTYSYWLACPLGLAGTAGLLGMRAWHPRIRSFTTRSSMFDLVLLESIFATGMLLLTAGPVGLDHMISDLVRFPAFPGNHPAVWRVHVALLVFFLVY